MINKNLLSAAVAVGLLAGASVASACTLDSWSDRSGTGEIAGGPNEAGAAQFARFSNQCSMRTTGGYVQDLSPSAESSMNTRFYVFIEDGTGTATIYETFSDQPAVNTAGTSVYRVDYAAGMLTFTAAGGSAATVAVNDAAWNSVEVNYTASGTADVFVNIDSTTAAQPSATFNTGAGTINSARLGADGAVGTVAFLFDDYDSRRETQIGEILVGDTQADGDVDIFDAVALVGELVNGVLVEGAPDLQLDGDVDIFDAVGLVSLIVNG